MNLTPNGKGHRMLARLDDGPAWPAELYAAAGEDRPGKRQMWRVLTALRCAGLATRDAAGAYLITPPGADALACLRAGYPATVGATGGVAAQGQAA